MMALALSGLMFMSLVLLQTDRHGALMERSEAHFGSRPRCGVWDLAENRVRDIR